MKLQEYQNKAKRTSADLGSDKLNLSHMVMGMCTELPELEDAIINKDITNIGEELADIYWYIANYETFRGYKTETVKRLVGINSGGVVLGVGKLYRDIGLLQDIIKKYVAYNKEIDTIIEEELLHVIKYNLSMMFKLYELNESEYLQKNIDKLIARYPDKFTEHDAVNRDLETERKILES